MGQVPPQHLEAEESVLGAMMLTPAAIDAVIGVVEPKDFYRESHGCIYQAALALHAKSEPVDAITLTNELEQRGELDQAGGRTRLHELARLVPTSVNARHYAQLVRESATLRGLIRVGGEIAQLGWDREGEPDELVGHAHQLVTDLAARENNSGFAHAADGVKDTMQQLLDQDRDGMIGAPTGFRGLDEATAGLQAGNLILLAARPSVGKSALALAIAWHTATHAGPVAIATLEMSRAEITQRLMARLGHVNLHDFRRGRLDAEQTRRVFQTAPMIEKTPIYVDDHAASLHEIRARARQTKAKHGLELLIVDYLQLVADQTGRRSDTRNDEVARVSRGLKLLAVDLDVPVLACAQLNRNIELRNEKRPQLSDLRDSGALEQDANVVIFMHREGVYDKTKADDNTTELIIAKNRNGPLADTKIAFVRAQATFTDQHLAGVL